MDTVEEDARAVRWNAAFVGTAFCVATAAGAVAAAIESPLREFRNYLGRLAVDEGTAGLMAFLTKGAEQ